jgi:hypothetical protein
MSKLKRRTDEYRESGERSQDNAFSKILRHLGYRDLADWTREHQTAFYQEWRSYASGQLFFRNIGMGKVSEQIKWTHRKYLNHVFIHGEEEIERVAGLGGAGIRKEIGDFYHCIPGVYDPDYKWLGSVASTRKKLAE